MASEVKSKELLKRRRFKVKDLVVTKIGSGWVTAVMECHRHFSVSLLVRYI